jgi:hypothetical protein
VSTRDPARGSVGHPWMRRAARRYVPSAGGPLAAVLAVAIWLEGKPPTPGRTSDTNRTRSSPGAATVWHPRAAMPNPQIRAVIDDGPRAGQTALVETTVNPPARQDWGVRGMESGHPIRPRSSLSSGAGYWDAYSPCAQPAPTP